MTGEGTTMERGYTVEELWAAVRRRARMSLVIAAGVLVLGAVVVAGLPDEYRAEATIVLEPYRPHSELVTSSVTTLLEDRLRVARQQLLARPLLEKVVREFDLYPETRETDGMPGAIERLRAHLEVVPDGESAVIVAFRTGLKEKAAPVVTAIASGWAEANAQLRTGQAKRVLEILDSEMKDVRTRLDEQEAKVRAFRLAHDGELPEQVESNMREAERATRILDGTLAHMRDLERRRALLPDTPSSPEVSRLAVMESDLLRQLNHAKSLYADTHPEPQRLERELDGLRELKVIATGAIASARREKASIARELKRAKEDVAEIEKRIGEARDRASAGAKWGAELAVLERDRDLLREKHRSLLSRKVESEVALGLEEKSALTATHVVSPPGDPTTPFAPDRLRLLLAVLALALGAGIATGVLLESRDGSVRTPDQVRSLGVPVVGVVPSIDRRGA